MNSKEQFLKTQYIDYIKQLDPDSERKWGTMNVQQMIEHMSDAFRMANGKELYLKILTPEEKLARMQAFVLSDTPFKENTKNVLMSEIPADIKFEKIADSIYELDQEVKDFFIQWELKKDQIIRNPFFGDLDFEHWVSLMYKHCWHHLNQFGMNQK